MKLPVRGVLLGLSEVAEAAVRQIQLEPPCKLVDEVGHPNPLIGPVIPAVVLLIMCEGEDFMLNVLRDTEMKPAV